ncbi:antirestriction protein, partial [bacterium]|nr:antirestriction protein [bacterium]
HFPFRLEPAIYNTAGRLSADYTGGYWLMYRLENGGFYMAPDENMFRVSCMNGFEGALSGDAFGIVVCLYAYSELAFSTIPELAEPCGEQYHLLREYVFEHPEAAAIFGAID